MSPAPPPPPPPGAVLVRVPAHGQGWAARLPAVPRGRVLTVTVGHDSLLPVPVDDLIAGGYRIVGVADTRRPVGDYVDVLVPGDLREGEPGWWQRLVAAADRVFDLRMGPVRALLGPEIDLHLTASR